MAGQDRTTPDGVSGADRAAATAAPGQDAARRDQLAADHRRAASHAEGELLDLLRRVGEEPWAFDFFQLMRRIETLSAVAYDAPGVGRSLKTREDPIRFGQEPSLAFAPRSINSVRTRAGVTRMLVNFMGMLGPQGPMPSHFTEYVRSRELHHQDPTWARFLDVFNNRMVGLLYRAWAMSRPTVGRDATAAGQPERDRFALYVSSLFGLATPGLQDRDSVPDDAKRFFAGRFANQTRSPEGLAAILRDFFGTPVRIDEFIGRWSELPEHNKTLLGRKGVASLGESTILGARVWECQSTVRVTLGPMNRQRYDRLLPGGEGHARLMSWLKMFGGEELGWEVVLTLQRQETPRPKLGSGVRLGYSCWLVRETPADDRSDVVIRSR